MPTNEGGMALGRRASGKDGSGQQMLSLAWKGLLKDRALPGLGCHHKHLLNNCRGEFADTNFLTK
jgi:hypothetical protein